MCTRARVCRCPDPHHHPHRPSLPKALIRSEKAQRDVVMYFDLHGHSRKMNVFMYGCDDRRKPRPAVRVFPKLLSWNAIGRQYVSFGDCSFHVKKSREGTGRVVVARELGIANAFTLETTFCGASFGPLKGCHFNTAHLVEVEITVDGSASRRTIALWALCRNHRERRNDDRMERPPAAVPQGVHASARARRRDDAGRCGEGVWGRERGVGRRGAPRSTPRREGGGALPQWFKTLAALGRQSSPLS